MPTPDLGPVLSAVTDYGDARADHQAQQDAELVAQLTAERDAALRQRDEAVAAYAEHMRTEHPEEPPEPAGPSPLIGVRVFPHYRNAVYGHHAAVLDKLTELGVKRISCQLDPTPGADVIKFLQDADRRGIKAWCTVEKPRVRTTAAGWDSYRSLLTGPLAGIVEKAWCWNEPNHVRNANDAPLTGWVQNAVAQQRELYTHTKAADPSIVVGTVQLWSGSTATQNADADALVAAGYRDRITVGGKSVRPYDEVTHHYYPRGDVTEAAYQAQYDALTKRFDPEKALGFTTSEAGLFTAPNYSGQAKVVTPEVQARELAELVVLHLDRGWGLSIFELLDDPDPSGTVREASLGIVFVDVNKTGTTDPAFWRNKPAVASIREANQA